MKRVLIALVVGTAAICCTAPAAHAVPPQLLGQNPTAEGELGGCQCSMVQLASGAASSYLAPFSGVLTKTQVWVGPTTESGDWFQARTYRTSGPADAKVISQGEEHSLSGLSSGAIFFADRIPMAGGDVLGARFHDSALRTETPARFKAGPGDLVGGGPFAAEVGDSFTSTTTSEWRANVVATLEADEDNDGYGDSTQDLCPGSPIATAACSGALFGSDLAGLHGDFFNCGFACLNIQKSIGGHSTAAAQDGVVVRWRLLGATTGSYRIRVVAPGGGQYTILHSSDPVSVTTEPRLTEKISTFATRLPIPAGAYVALATPIGAHFGSHAGGGSYEDINDHVVDGTTSPMIGEAIGTLLYDADIEPDADHDGYGDITQDSCPGTATVHDGQCPVIDVFPPPATPKISGLEVVPKKFRVKAKGNSAKLKLTLSREATVAFGIEAKKACAGKGKGKKARCKPGFHAVQTITQKLPAGQSAVPYSARLRGRAPLQSGSYRVTAVPTAGGITGKATQATFTVLPPRHRTPR